MGRVFGLLTVVGAICLIALPMRLLWRRMQRTRAAVREIGREDAVREPIGFEEESRDGYFRGRPSDVNEGLLDQGAAARETRWPVN